MKKLLLAFALALVATVPAHAQLGNVFLHKFPGAPTGTCSNSLQTAINTSNGDFYDCVGTTWTKISGGGGVTSFSGDGALLSNSASTGAVTATLATAAADTVMGNPIGSPATPVYTANPVVTSLIAKGIVDGTMPINNTSTTACTLGVASTNCGALSFSSGTTFNQEGTAATGVTYTLPATVQGETLCVANSIVSGTGAANTGVLTVYPPSSSYVIYKGTINTIGGGGTHGIASGGAAADSACFVANDSTHWTVYVSSGTWTEN